MTKAARVALKAFLLELKENQVVFSHCREVDVNTRGFMGETPLKFAVVRQDEQSVRNLLAAGADPNTQGEDDDTPLHHAAGRENSEIVRLLLVHGACTSVVNRYGAKPIDHAISNLEIHTLLRSSEPNQTPPTPPTSGPRV